MQYCLFVHFVKYYLHKDIFAVRRKRVNDGGDVRVVMYEPLNSGFLGEPALCFLRVYAMRLTTPWVRIP
jgi:hypothetical protein